MQSLDANNMVNERHTTNNTRNKGQQCSEQSLVHSGLTSDQKQELQILIAESVKQTLIQLGITSNDPIEMQKDMQHLREWRKSMDSIRNKSILSLITIAVTGVAAALWIGLKELLAK